MLARFRRDPAFTDAGAPEPPGELLDLRARIASAVAHIDDAIAEERRFEDAYQPLIDALLDVRNELSPPKGSRLLRPAVPVIPGRSS